MEKVVHTHLCPFNNMQPCDPRCALRDEAQCSLSEGSHYEVLHAIVSDVLPDVLTDVLTDFFDVEVIDE